MLKRERSCCGSVRSPSAAIKTGISGKILLMVTAAFAILALMKRTLFLLALTISCLTARAGLLDLNDDSASKKKSASKSLLEMTNDDADKSDKKPLKAMLAKDQDSKPT